MLKSFEDIKEKLKSLEIKKVAVAVAEDQEVLAAVRQAQDEGLAIGVLTGDESKIREIAKNANISLDGFEIINEPNPVKAATLCCQLIREGKASAIMKGLIDTSKYMKAILNKETGLNSGKLLSHVAVFELDTYDKLLMVSDAAINIAPDLNEKVGIINNCVKFAHSLGLETPLVACCAAVEKVNQKMPATVDAALLAKMSDRGQISGCIVDGPFGLDNAISEESVRIKKIKSPVAGKADIILCNDIESGNYLYKSLMFLANATAGAVVMGAAAPIILTSRADSHKSKYLSIVLGLMSAK